MPPKSVVCSVCGAEVLKAQTYARRDGSRACRSHPEVAEEAANLKEQKKSLIPIDMETTGMQLDSMDPASLRRMAKQFSFAERYRGEHTSILEGRREKLHTHCWVCDQECVSLRRFMEERLIALKRLELRGELNFLTMNKDMAALMPGMIPLIELPLRDEVIDKAIVKHVRDKNTRSILRLIGFIRICGPCAGKHGFAKRVDEIMPHPTFDQVMKFMASPLATLISDATTEIAKKKEQQS